MSDELFAKYDSLLLNTALDTLNDIVYCPRTFCHYPVSLEPEEQLAICAQCQYVFCVYCKAVYHGVEPCKYKTGMIFIFFPLFIVFKSLRKNLFSFIYNCRRET